MNTVVDVVLNDQKVTFEKTYNADGIIMIVHMPNVNGRTKANLIWVSAFFACVLPEPRQYTSTEFAKLIQFCFVGQEPDKAVEILSAV